MKSKWITHDGARILYCDFRDFAHDVAALTAEVDEVDEEMLRQPPGSVLALADLHGTFTSAEGVTLLKMSATRTKDHISKQAVVGISGIQKILAQGVAWFSGQSLYLFDDAEQALAWLARGEGGGVELKGGR